ncbi:S-DNA-T family DNA segregation ATPase FtsK/SpoIIIE [Paenibacillus harenae]|uniref:S-DNA-T family DNA segregation ATPase FtsK/SpoIIIE n=2 Tax=Paenibacillus harenae TaxID=306543 RepID=A0ABT9TW53_PAEHA|nr:S-DNA-T family DNA segregation ATPase FtsK/SpoIIIE [Paenibacillus harenae]
MLSKAMGRGNFYIIQIIAMSTMLVSYLVPILLYIQQRKQFQKQVSKRKQAYQAYLDEQREILQNMKNEMILQLHTHHPEPDTAFRWLQQRDSKIWARIPSDPDYLNIRTGIGVIQSGFKIDVPKQDAIEKEPLLEKAQEMADKFISISNAPVLLNLQQHRVIGIVGDIETATNLSRSLVSQIALHHSPDEVKLSALFGQQDAAHWDWMRWLPHTWDEQRRGRFLFQEGLYPPQQLEALLASLQRRKWIGQGMSSGKRVLPNFVFIVPDVQIVEQEPIWPMLLEEGERVNASCIILAQSRDRLPKECQVVIECSENEGVIRSTTNTVSNRMEEKEKLEQIIQYDQLQWEQADRFARALAPYQLKKATADEIPNVLTLFKLFDVQAIENLDVGSRWGQSRYPNALPVPIGVKGGSKPVMLNIHDKIERKGHGPHGLMAGTTGSGKSEVIQTLIASLAVNFHPHDLAFMLIDYKGGGMSNTFATLPHVIATITNLEEEGLIERSKVSLKAELERRQKLFVAAGNVQHIDEYYETEWRVKDPLPHLVIVIDEFAQLKKDQPEFMSELVSIAAIGRTLGVHLLLATQKPSGVVDDKIWSNSRYRVCLRVQDEGDSREMLKIPDAAYITNPGRGYLQVGTNEVFESVQFAWSGAPYRPDEGEQVQDDDLYGLELSGGRVKLASNRDLSIRQGAGLTERAVKPKKQLDVLIRWLAEEAERLGISRLPGPWQPPLPNYLSLEQVTAAAEAKEGLKPVVGLVDHVAAQSQLPLTIDIESGNWLIFGMPATGKTTFLQTLLYSLAISNTPNDVHVYIIDFSRMLKDYIQLPHVGDVLQEEDEEKFVRFFDFLDKEIARRKQLFSDTGVKSRLAYCEDTGNELPAILLIVDGYINLKGKPDGINEKFENVLRVGSSLGIYAIVTANRPAEMMEKIKSNFPNAVSYQLADPSDYHNVVGRLPKPPAVLPEGRGFIKGSIPPLQFQTVLAIDAENDSSRSKKLRERFQFMQQMWTGAEPRPIATLPEEISLALMEKTAQSKSMKAIALGLQVSDLEPFYFSAEEGPYFMVSGRMESGKSSLLVAIGLETAELFSPLKAELYLSDFRRSDPGLSALRELSHVKGYASDERSLEPMLLKLRQEIERRAKEGYSRNGDPILVLLIDDADVTAKRVTSISPVTQSLDYLIQHGRDLGLYILLAGNSPDLQQNWDAWMKSFKANQTGFLLGTTDMSDVQLFGIKLPFEISGKMLPPGEGLYIRRKYQKIKAVYPHADEGEHLQQRLQAVENKWMATL